MGLFAANLLLLTLDGGVLLAERRLGPPVVWAGWALVCVLGVLLGFAGDDGHHAVFQAARILCCAFFLHGVLLWGWVAARRRSRWSGGLAVAIAAVGIDAFVIEPTWLEEEHHTVVLENLDEPLRVVLVADLQADRIGPYEREVFARIQAAEPDLVVFAGDYLQIWDEEAWATQADLLRPLIAGLEAPLGVFAVGGDVDDPRWPTLFAPEQVLQGSRDLGSVVLTGLSPEESRWEEPPVAGTSKVDIVVGHAPDYALAEPPVELMLAGHVHGGQVRLPLIGPLITLSRVPRSQAVGRSRMGQGWLVVSRGIGMERGNAPRLRFLCRPELTLLDLLPAGTTSTPRS